MLKILTSKWLNRHHYRQVRKSEKVRITTYWYHFEIAISHILCLAEGQGEEDGCDVQEPLQVVVWAQEVGKPLQEDLANLKFNSINNFIPDSAAKNRGPL